MNRHDISTQTIDYPQELLFVALKHSRSGPYSISYRGYARKLLCDELSEREQQFLLCSTCKGIMFEASISTDNKILCSICIPTGSTATPVAAFRESIGAFPARCPLCLRGCDWIGTLATIQSHVESCNYLFIICTLGCGELMLQELLTGHIENTCMERYISCELCMQSIRAGKLSEHLETCPNFIVSCKECEEKLKRCHLETHLIDLCKNRLVKCTYYKYGCRDMIRFCEVSQHMDNTKDVHITCLEKNILKKEDQLETSILEKENQLKKAMKKENQLETTILEKENQLKKAMEKENQLETTILEKENQLNKAMEKENQLETTILENENQLKKVKMKMENQQKPKLKDVISISKQLLSSDNISVRFPCEMYISEFRVGHKRVIDRGISIDFQGKSLKLVLTQESNNRLYFALVFPSCCTGNVTTILINQDNALESVLFENAKIICRPCIKPTEMQSDELKTTDKLMSKREVYSLISTGLEGVLIQPPYLQGGYFELKLKLSIDSTEVDYWSKFKNFLL